mmetsp:Transcript_92610/g.261574  ORF Transcript_92610/g.261574 Transcript_92610/m.261574 type:complete len:85 (+) Transcript_92610:192-446(+)
MEEWERRCLKVKTTQIKQCANKNSTHWQGCSSLILVKENEKQYLLTPKQLPDKKNLKKQKKNKNYPNTCDYLVWKIGNSTIEPE